MRDFFTILISRYKHNYAQGHYQDTLDSVRIGVILCSLIFGAICYAAQCVHIHPSDPLHAFGFALSQSVWSKVFIQLSNGLALTLMVLYFLNAFKARKLDLLEKDEDELWGFAPGGKKPKSTLLEQGYITLVSIFPLSLIVGMLCTKMIVVVLSLLVQLRHLPQVMKEKNQQYLNENPAEAAKLLNRHLPKSKLGPAKKRL